MVAKGYLCGAAMMTTNHAGKHSHAHTGTAQVFMLGDNTDGVCLMYMVR